MIYKILGFVILPALLTAFFASIIPRKLEKRRRFKEAAKTFQDAFIPQLSFLKHNTNIGGIGSTDDISGLLSFGYVHYHLKAFKVFRKCLSTKKRAGIDKAWQKCYHPDDPKILNVSRFSNKSSNGEQKSKKELEKLTAEAIERIEEILKFAEHKR